MKLNLQAFYNSRVMEVWRTVGLHSFMKTR
jgi:hypothetical protein